MNRSSIPRATWPALLLALSALGVAVVDWARFGHHHAEAGGVVHHAHPHVGGHDHHDRPGHSHRHDGEPGHDAPADSPAEPRRPEDSRSVYFASSLLSTVDLHPPLAVDRPAPADHRVASRPSPLAIVDDRHDPSTPRGPPAS